MRASTNAMFCSVTRNIGAFCAGFGLTMRRMRRASPPDSVTSPPPSSTVARLATSVLVTTIVLGAPPWSMRIVPPESSAAWICAVVTLPGVPLPSTTAPSTGSGATGSQNDCACAADATRASAISGIRAIATACPNGTRSPCRPSQPCTIASRSATGPSPPGRRPSRPPDTRAPASCRRRRACRPRRTSHASYRRRIAHA